MARDNFSSNTRRVLAERASYMCSRPECQKATIGPHSEDSRSSCIGRAAHICAAATGGPRFDANQTAVERSSIKNGIWLCANCADLIDTDPRRFQETILEKWKQAAELKALGALSADFSQTAVESAESIDALMDEAFDALAGSQYATRITWRGTPKTIYEKVARLLRKAKSISPNNARLILIEACYLVGRGFPEKALELLDKNPGMQEQCSRDLLRARCHHDMGSFSESLAILERVCDEPSPTAAALHNLGIARMKIGDRDAAARSFRAAIDIEADYAEAHMMLGVLVRDAGDSVKALHHFGAAYSLNSNDEGIALRFSRCLLDLERLSPAVDVLDAVIDKFPASADAWAFLGEAFGRAERYFEADEALSRALAIDPCNVVAVNNQLMSFAGQGRLSDILKLIDSTRSLDFSKPKMLDDFEHAARSIIR